jgi:hypothetical protein
MVRRKELGRAAMASQGGTGAKVLQQMRRSLRQVLQWKSKLWKQRRRLMKQLQRQQQRKRPVAAVDIKQRTLRLLHGVVQLTRCFATRCLCWRSQLRKSSGLHSD